MFGIQLICVDTLWQLKIVTYHNIHPVVFDKYPKTVRLLAKMLTLFL